MALLLSECRMLYENKKVCEIVIAEQKAVEFKKKHLELKDKTAH